MVRERCRRVGAEQAVETNEKRPGEARQPPPGRGSATINRGSGLSDARGLLGRREDLSLRGHHFGRGGVREYRQRPRDNAGPAGLVAGAEAGAVVAVEVLVEEDVVAPVRVVLELLGAAVDRPTAAGVAPEDRRETIGN